MSMRGRLAKASAVSVTMALAGVVAANPATAAPPKATAAVPGLNEAAVAAPAVPTFVNGMSQNVFSATRADWVTGEVWVESDFDSDLDGKKDRILSQKSYRTAQDIAMAVTAGKIFLPEVASSTHYYAQYVSPRWARSMEKMKKIGLHIFYRTYGGGWS